MATFVCIPRPNQTHLYFLNLNPMRTIFLLLSFAAFSVNTQATSSRHHLSPHTSSLHHPITDSLQITCPADVVVSCEQFDPSLMAYGQASVSGISCPDSIWSMVSYAQFDTVCNRGTIARTFQALDCDGDLGQCVQHVVVNYEQFYFVKFPDDTLVTTCNSTGIYGQPTFYGVDCELMSLTYEDEIFPIILPDACYRIDRTWTVINWCTYNPSLPLNYVPNPALVSTTYHNPLNAPGPIVSACDAPAPWMPTISKINSTDTLDTNFCTFWSANANGYRYRHFIRIIDTALPSFTNCPATPQVFVDSTNNDPNLWSSIYDPALPIQNLNELEVELSVHATDVCSGGHLGMQYQLFLDLDSDSVQESVVDCYNPPPAGIVYYGNAFLPNYIGGTPILFDSRPVPQHQKWRFTVEKTHLEDTIHSAVRWNTMEFPNASIEPQLPSGTHKIRWIAQDGCGNESSCDYYFTIQSSNLECTPPAEVVVSCEQFDPSLLTYGEPTLVSTCCIDTLLTSANYAQFDTVCNRGTITRIFNALDCCGNAAQCSQRVVVNYVQNYFIKFPDDIRGNFCDWTGNYGAPIGYGDECELLSITYNDQQITPVPDACIIIARDWTVINWCTYNPAQSIIYVPNPNPFALVGNPANLPGPTVSACGTAPPWTSTVVKINPTDSAPTDFCTYWNANANGYHYTQSIKITDTEPPVFLDCPQSLGYLTDLTPNDAELWNHVFNPNLPAQDLGELSLDLSVTLTDSCSGSNINIEYQLFLDLDADSQQETVVNSISLGQAGLGWNNVLYNNINTPGFLGGTPVAFDARPVPDAQKWGFSIQESISGTMKAASLRWNTALSPNTHVLPQLPNGRHKIKWYATDGCGNNLECEQVFSIGDTTLVGTQMLDNNGFVLYQNEPNPFGDQTNIRFQLPEPSPATLTILDVEGRVLFRHNADYAPGVHSLRLEKDQFPSPGVFFYKLEAGPRVAWRKMVMH